MNEGCKRAWIKGWMQVASTVVGVAGVFVATWMTGRLEGVKERLAETSAEVLALTEQLSGTRARSDRCEHDLGLLTSRFNPLEPPGTGWVHYGEKHRGRMESRLFDATSGDAAKVPDVCDVVEARTFVSVLGGALIFQLSKGEWFEGPAVGVIRPGVRVQVERVQTILGGWLGGDTYIAYRVVDSETDAQASVASCAQRIDQLAKR